MAIYHISLIIQINGKIIQTNGKITKYLYIETSYKSTKKVSSS